MPIFMEIGNVRLFPMSILLGIVNSHVWVLYNIPELGNHFKNGILLGNVKTIYSNSHFSKLGITMGFPIKTQSNLKWEFKNNPNFYLVLNFLEYFQLSQWRKLWVSSKRIFWGLELTTVTCIINIIVNLPQTKKITRIKPFRITNNYIIFIKNNVKKPNPRCLWKAFNNNSLICLQNKQGCLCNYK